MSRRRMSDGNGDKLTGLFGGAALSLGNNDDNQDSGRPSALRVKIISMGESGVGKSCAIKRYCEEKFVSKYISTIGIDYGVKPVMVNGAEVRVNFWDLSGLPEYLEVRNEFYKDTQGGILMFDVSSRRSFEYLDSWLREAAKFGAGKFPCILCGNKVDRPRVVSEDEATAYAQSKGFEYFETSACTGVSISEAFHSLFRTVVKHVTR
ncbi:DnaJ-like protein subfamily C member 27 [Phytophthora ramorum]|nr:DnaJ-like protein subfamily C member 27 [Phytophthora ramorum]